MQENKKYGLRKVRVIGSKLATLKATQLIKPQDWESYELQNVYNFTLPEFFVRNVSVVMMITLYPL